MTSSGVCPACALTVLGRRRYGYTTVCVPCGWRNPLCLQAVAALFCIFNPSLCLPAACPAYPILLSGKPAALAQTRAAPQLRARGDAGILLFVGQRLVVGLRGGRQARPPGLLPGGLGIKRFEPPSPPLVAVPYIPHPVAAAAALERGIIKAFA